MRYDVSIIGGGPAGSTLAALLQRQGVSTVIIEKNPNAEGKIGESLIPAALDIFEEAGSLPHIQAENFTYKTGGIFRWGAETPWDFRFSEHPVRNKYSYAFQVERECFDPLLLDYAATMGSECLRGWRAVRVEGSDLVVKDPLGKTKKITSEFVADCGGAKSILAKQRGRRYDPRFKQIALFSRYEGINRLSGERGGDIICDASDDGWVWMIPLRNGITSVGYVTSAGAVNSIESDLEQAIDHAPFAKTLAQSRSRITPVRAIADYSYETRSLLDRHTALVGDAGNFIDPVWSTGIALTVRSAKYLADALPNFLNDRNEEVLRKVEEDTLSMYDSYRSFVTHFYALNGSKSSTMWKAHELIPGAVSEHAAFLEVISGKMRGYQ